MVRQSVLPSHLYLNSLFSNLYDEIWRRIGSLVRCSRKEKATTGQHKFSERPAEPDIIHERLTQMFCDLEFW
jgi:hypothetical protein